MALDNITNWKFKAQHVQPAELTQDGTAGGAFGNFISSESMVMAAGPAVSSDFDINNIYPIGVCDTVQVGQNKTIHQLWEIGSREPYFIPGRNFITGTIGRVLFNGDSLMGAVYRTSETGVEDPSIVQPAGNTILNGETDNKGMFYMNLASDLFNRPFGLCLFIQDSESQWVAAYYLENCYIQAHSLTLQSQQIVVGENIQFRCTKIVPIKTEATGG
jgi:hypothetical protein